MTAAGFPWNSYGESIAAGYADTASALAGLIIDNGIPDLGHRRHLLAIDALYQPQEQVGVGIVMGGTWGVGAAMAMEAAPSEKRGLLSGLLQEGYAADRVSFAEIYQRLMNWNGHARQANTYRLRCRLFDTICFQRATTE